MKTKIIYAIIVPLCFIISACKKDWLEEKRDIKLIVPKTLSDLRLLLNNNEVLGNDYTGITEMAAGDFYLSSETWKSLEYFPEPRAYNWQNPFVGFSPVSEWDGSYAQIETCNVVLEALAKITVGSINLQEWSDIKGGALFLRARAFFNLSQVFSAPYNDANADKPAIPLRISADINIEIKRNTVKETYQQIIADLQASVQLLKTVPQNKINASKPAAYGQLARCFLSMGDYANAKLYADSCLAIYNTLLDYDKLDPSAFFPFPMFNDEVIMHSGLLGNYFSFYFPNGTIQKSITDLYSDNDLRKTLFFRNNGNGNFSMRGFYFGFRTAFSGLATDEILLIRAECMARANQITQAMADLNTLLIKRFKRGSFTPLVAATPNEALSIIITERHKELLLRGLRWSDLRRLNPDPQFATTLTRTIDNQIYRLKPNDDRYVFPLPDYVIRDYKLQQNPGW